MNPPRLLNRRAERFARALEGAEPDGPTVGLVQLATALRTAGEAIAAAPEPAFRTELRQRLVAVATVQADLPEPAVTSRRFTRRLQRRVGAMASGVAMVTAVAGVGVAAARSLPGDPFYDVKRATEAVQLWTAHGDLAKGHRQLEFARTRLAEARALHNPSRSTMAATLRDMDGETRAGTADLVSAYHSSGSTTPLADIDRFARQQFSGLVALARQLPEPIRGVELPSLRLVGTVEKQVRTLTGNTCLSCRPAPAVVPRSSGTPAPVKSRPAKPGNSRPGGTTTTPGGTSGNGGQPSGGKPTLPRGTKPTVTPVIPSVVPSLPTHPSLPSVPTKLTVPTLSPLPLVTKLLPGHH